MGPTPSPAHRRLVIWLIPLLAILAAIVFLAWKVAETPGSPFIYDR
jgi:hypothetical protein